MSQEGATLSHSVTGNESENGPNNYVRNEVDLILLQTHSAVIDEQAGCLGCPCGSVRVRKLVLPQISDLASAEGSAPCDNKIAHADG